MTRNKKLSLFIFVLLLTPCSLSPSSSNAQDNTSLDSSLSCDFDKLIGQKAEEIDKSQLGNHAIRVIKPGQPITMDYSPSRINLHTDRYGKILSVSCG